MRSRGDNENGLAARVTVREWQIQLASARLDQIDTTGLSRDRLAMLAETTVAYVARWQRANGLSPLRGPDLPGSTNSSPKHKRP